MQLKYHRYDKNVYIQFGSQLNSLQKRSWTFFCTSNYFDVIETKSKKINFRVLFLKILIIYFPYNFKNIRDTSISIEILFVGNKIFDKFCSKNFFLKPTGLLQIQF